MKAKIELCLCSLILITYRIIHMITNDLVTNINVLSIIICGLGLIGFIFVNKKNKLIALIPLGMYVVGMFMTIDFTNIITYARLYELRAQDEGIAYYQPGVQFVLNYITDIILLNVLFLAILVDVYFGSKNKVPFFICLMILTIVAMVTAFYHVPFDGTELATVGLKLLAYYLPIFLIIREVCIDYDKLQIIPYNKHKDQEA